MPEDRESVINLFTSIPVYEQFIASRTWHHAYVKESHVHTGTYDVPGGIVDNGISLARALVGNPDADHALELVAFEVSSFTVWGQHDFEPQGEVIVQRRKAQLDFGALQLQATCLGYRVISLTHLAFGQYYTDPAPFDEYGNLLYPYDLDWRLIMDEAKR